MRDVIDPTDVLDFVVWIHDEGEAVRVLPCGEVDIATAPVLRHALGMAGSRSSQVVIIDLRDVPFMDVHGLNELLAARKEIACERDLFVVNTRPQVRRVMRLVDLSEALLL
jgi:anti-anti-sigma factor